MQKPTTYDYFYARQFAYDLLRRLFLEEPTVELLNHLQCQSSFDCFPVAENDAASIAAINAVKAYLNAGCFKANEEDFENLHWDFTRLFIGPETPPAPPWQSLYVSQDKLLFQRNTRQVNDYYTRHGFMMNPDDVEAADHIGFELDFLYRLSSQTVSLLEEESTTSCKFKPLLDSQLRFLQQHLLAFSGDFARSVRQHAETDFYRAVSTLLEQFLLQDKENLNRYIEQ